MNLNVREALVALSRALPLVLFRAGVYVAGGFAVIMVFGMLLMAARLAAGAGRIVAVGIALLAVPAWWLGGRVLQRFFLYRQRAAMLLAFSGCSHAAGGMAATIEVSKGLIPDHSRWTFLNRSLRGALFAFIQGNSLLPSRPAGDRPWGLTRILDLLAMGHLGQAILSLAYARGGTDGGRAAREGLVLYFNYGMESRRLARKWLLFSASAQFFLFLCLAVPNWLFFRSAGAPVWIGVILAVVIARLLHQAFIVPLVLAGVSAALLAETQGHTPDPAFCEKIAPLLIS